MVRGLSVWLTLWLCHTPPPQSANPAAKAKSAAAKALAEGSYPWYDAKKDAIAPVEPPWTPSWWDWLPSWKFGSGSRGLRLGGLLELGNLLVFLVLVIGLAALIAGLVWAYRHYMPDWGENAPKKHAIGTASFIGGLPPGLPADLTDPFGLARELRARGDLSGAILALFVHQVVTLDRLRIARLAPGRTARQLVRSITDAWVRARVEPTLRLFETSYYGHRPPPEAAFERAWSLAEEFEAKIAAGGFVG